MAAQMRKLKVLLVFGVLIGSACGVSDEGGLPPDVPDSATLHSPSGALARYRGAVGDLPTVFDVVMAVSGVFTDELAGLPLTLGTLARYTFLDSRVDPSDAGRNPFVRLNRLRGQVREARGFLDAYLSDSSRALPGHLLTLEGYAEIFLADLFCSGIPLSTVDFDGNFTPAAGSSTKEVYEHALALFETADTLSSDSARIQLFAAMGRGRALLALGRYAEAAAVVASVPDDYRYQFSFPWVFQSGASAVLTDSAILMFYGTRPTTSFSNSLRIGAPSVGNQEGSNGLNYLTSGDPRTLGAAKGTDGASPTPHTLFYPRKYTTGTSANTISSPTTFTIASGIEARLIEAESALQAGDLATWLAKLNQPRQSLAACGTIVPATTCPLSALEDPGPDTDGDNDLRVNLLFRERAFWLYLTAHRQGDLRRLVRQYLRAPNAVYPSGAYPGGTGAYGNYIVLPVPKEEAQLNQSYAGCLHLDA